MLLLLLSLLVVYSVVVVVVFGGGARVVLLGTAVVDLLVSRKLLLHETAAPVDRLYNQPWKESERERDALAARVL